MNIKHTSTITVVWSVLIKKLKHVKCSLLFVLCSALLSKVSECFPFVHRWGKGVFSMSLPLLLWNNTVLVARHLHPLKTTLCHLFKTWALNRKFDFYRSNYGGSTSPLAVLPCRNHANRALHLTLPCSNRSVNDCSYLRENHTLKKKNRKSQRYSVYSFLKNPFSIGCVFENTQYLNQIVSLNTFFPPFEINVFYILHPCMPISMMEEYQ